MRSIIILSLCASIFNVSIAQNFVKEADSLKNNGLLMLALEKYGAAFMKDYSPTTSYQIASTCALLWTKEMRDTSFYFLNYALQKDHSLSVLYDPDFLSLIDDERWENIENAQIKKYENQNTPIENKAFAKALFRMIIKDQGFMYAGNIERKKFMDNGGFFSSPTVFPMLAMEEKNIKENEKELVLLLDKYGWPTTSSVGEHAAAGAALVINHTNYELRSKYFFLLEEAFKKGEAQPLRYAKMKDRLLVEEGKEQLYGTQWKYEESGKVPYKIKDPEYVDKRRAAIGLEPLSIYLKERFDIDWNVTQKK